MSWFRRRPPSPPRASDTHTGGEAAHRHARLGLIQQQAQQPEVDRVAESLRELRQRNHFAAQIRLIFQGGNVE